MLVKGMVQLGSNYNGYSFNLKIRAIFEMLYKRNPAMHFEILVDETCGQAAIAVSSQRSPHISCKSDTWDSMFDSRDDIMDI